MAIEVRKSEDINSLDRVKNRDDWEWGDIYKGDLIMFKFTIPTKANFLPQFVL